MLYWKIKIKTQSFVFNFQGNAITNFTIALTYLLAESVCALIWTPIAVSHTMSSAISDVNVLMSTAWPSQSGFNRETSVRHCRSNISGSCSNIEKWKAGVIILRRLCHFLPLLKSRPSPSHGRNTLYVLLLAKNFVLLPITISSSFGSLTNNPV